MCFSRVLQPPVSGSAMETHILSLDLEVQAGNFQLPAAVFADSLPRSFQPQEKPFVTSPVTLNPLSETEKEGRLLQLLWGLGPYLWWLGTSPQSIYQTVSIWSCNGRVFSFQLIGKQPRGRNIRENLCSRNSHGLCLLGGEGLLSFQSRSTGHGRTV